MVPGARARPCRRLLQHGRVGGLDGRGAARRVGHPDAQLAVRLRPHRRNWTLLVRSLAAVLSIAGETQNAVTTGTRLHPLGPGAPPRRRRQTFFPECACPAELLGHRHSEVSGGSDVGHADVLVTALSHDGTWIRSEANRPVRVAALPSR